MKYKVIAYDTIDGKIPLNEWLDSLDAQERYRLTVRIERLELGNFSNCESVGESVSEIKIDSGPGYRIYFSRIGSTILILLCGGTKRTQAKDIDKAKKYLSDYKQREKYGKRLERTFN